MNLDRFRLLHARRFARHKLRTALSVLGIASGVALVVAMTALLTSTDATARSTVALFGGGRYEIVTPAARRDQVTSALRSVPEIGSVREFVETPVMVDGVQAWLVALGPGDAPLQTSEARALSGVTGIRTGSGLPTSGLHAFTGLAGGSTNAAVAGRAPQSLAGRYGGRVVAADLDSARRLQGPLGTDTLAVFGRPDPGALHAAVDDTAHIRLVANRVDRARNTIEIMFSSLSVLAAMGLVVGGFLLFNTMNLTILDRRHEIASLRALGSDRRSIWRGVLAKAALLGGAGSAVGLILGVVLARSVIATVPDAFSRSLGTPLRTTVPAGLLVTAWVLGVATALVAAIPPARRTLRVEPLEALRPDHPGDRGQRLALRPALLAAGARRLGRPID